MDTKAKRVRKQRVPAIASGTTESPVVAARAAAAVNPLPPLRGLLRSAEEAGHGHLALEVSDLRGLLRLVEEQREQLMGLTFAAADLAGALDRLLSTLALNQPVAAVTVAAYQGMLETAEARAAAALGVEAAVLRGGLRHGA